MMHILHQTILWLDWIASLAWLLQVVSALYLVKRVPDLTKAETTIPALPLPRLSVIVPARNEADSIARTLESLLDSRGVTLEIIAVDDRSEDETGAIMDRMAKIAAGRGRGPAGGSTELRVLHIASLPPGWLGKTHAMAQASCIASGEWLLFTDGDVLFHPDALRRALQFATANEADHFVLLPTVILRSWGESMMVAFLTVMAVWAMRPWRVATGKRDAIGVGAFNLIRRDVYDALGGWEALRRSEERRVGKECLE